MKKLPPFMAAALLLLGVVAAAAQDPRKVASQVLAPFCNTQVANGDGILIDTSKLVADKSYCSPVIMQEKLRSLAPASQTLRSQAGEL